MGILPGGFSRDQDDEYNPSDELTPVTLIHQLSCEIELPVEGIWSIRHGIKPIYPFFSRSVDPLRTLWYVALPAQGQEIYHSGYTTLPDPACHFSLLVRSPATFAGCDWRQVVSQSMLDRVNGFGHYTVGSGRDWKCEEFDPTHPDAAVTYLRMQLEEIKFRSNKEEMIPQV